MMNAAPSNAATLLSPASNPLAFCFPKSASAPPLNALAAFVLDGNIKTVIISKIDTMISAINKTSYNGGPPLNTTTNYSIKLFNILQLTAVFFNLQTKYPRLQETRVLVMKDYLFSRL